MEQERNSYCLAVSNTDCNMFYRKNSAGTVPQCDRGWGDARVLHCLKIVPFKTFETEKVK